MLAKIVAFFKHYSPAILTGVLIGTSYIPFPPWASLFCFVPLWVFWSKHIQNDWKPIVISGWIAGFLLTLIGFNWVSFTIHEFGHMPWPVAILGLMAFCSFSNLDLALAGLTLYLIRRYGRIQGRPLLLLFPLITAVFEAHFPSIFEWNYGYTFYWSKLPIYQLAELVGFQGISSLVIVLNSMFFIAYLEPQKRRRYFAAGVGVFLALNLCGWSIEKTLDRPDQEVSVGIVQANIGNLEKQYAEKGQGFRDHILERYTTLTAQLTKENPGLNFVVWPETAFPATIYDTGMGDQHVESLKNAIAQSGVAHVIGGYGHENATSLPKNSVFLFNGQGQFQREHYYKTHLLAFGEYIPGVEYFPKLRQWIPAGEFARGHGPKVVEFEGLHLGIQICYESLFPEYTRALGDLGANVLVNVTNDSWYGTWQEPYQHMMMTLGRAVEVRRPLIRATNTGISTVVLADGTILEQSPMLKEWTGSFNVPYRVNPKATLYQTYPWLMDALLLMSLLILLGRGWFGRSKGT